MGKKLERSEIIKINNIQDVDDEKKSSEASWLLLIFIKQGINIKSIFSFSFFDNFKCRTYS